MGVGASSDRVLRVALARKREHCARRIMPPTETIQSITICVGEFHPSLEETNCELAPCESQPALGKAIAKDFSATICVVDASEETK